MDPWDDAVVDRLIAEAVASAARPDGDLVIVDKIRHGELTVWIYDTAPSASSESEPPCGPHT